jgi:hypothetical protein
MVKVALSSGIVVALAVCAFPASAETPPSTLLEVESKGAPLEVTVGDHDEHVGATCTTPCRLSLAPGKYVLSTKARGILRTHETISVPPEGARILVRADAKGARVAGVLLTALGGGMALMGGVMVGSVIASDLWDSYNTFYAVLGGVLFVGGVAQVVPGVLLLKNNHGGIDTQAPRSAGHAGRATSLVPTLTIRF